MQFCSIPRIRAISAALFFAISLHAAPAAAQSPQVRMQTVHSFAVDEGHDGRTALVEGPGGALHGVTLGGGAFLRGTIFRLKPNGEFVTLHTFDGSAEGGGQPGATPVRGPDGALYGRTQLGEASNYGTVYRLGPDGGFGTLHSFVPNNPFAVVSDTWLTMGADGWLYGVSRGDGAFDAGMLFRLRTDGSGYEVLHDFAGGEGGANPSASMVAGHDGALYGTTRNGGNGDAGLVYRFGLDTGFQVVTSLFDGGEADPAFSSAALTPLAAVGGDVLYGTSEFGGQHGAGAIFRVHTRSGRLTTVHSFRRGGDHGYGPTTGLAPSADGSLYGVTRFGGVKKKGTLFVLNARKQFAQLHSFGVPSGKDGRYPWGAPMVASDGLVYGMTAGGGTLAPFGTIYRLAPALTF